jgi:hypothetical protein
LLKQDLHPKLKAIDASEITKVFPTSNQHEVSYNCTVPWQFGLSLSSIGSRFFFRVSIRYCNRQQIKYLKAQLGRKELNDGNKIRFFIFLFLLAFKYYLLLFFLSVFFFFFAIAGVTAEESEICPKH